MASGTVNFAGSIITGSNNSNGILELTITLPSGRTIGPIGVLSGSYIASLGLEAGDLEALRSIQTNYFNIVGSIQEQINQQQTTVTTTEDPTANPNPDATTTVDVPIADSTTITSNQDPTANPSTTSPTPTPGTATGGLRGITLDLENTRGQATAQDAANYEQTGDWRVKLRLAVNADYLYNAPNPGILWPLAQTDGVIFPYTPQIQISYNANYEPQDLTHSNYKIFQYRSSSIDSVGITGDFTAQDTWEANYLLAVIHFFRSVTKMFYGQDQNPKLGTPPPLCYLTGLGAYQFDEHPLVITSFNYTLPTDVDYIRAGSATVAAGTDMSAYNNRDNSFSSSDTRLQGIAPGGVALPPKFQLLTNQEPTYVPTKIQLQITCAPIVSRMDISSRFSLEQYATGALLRGSKNGTGGIW